MDARPVLLAPLLGACLGTLPSRPVDIEVVAVAELPEFGPDTQLQVASYSRSKSAAALMSAGAECLVDPGYCDLTYEVGGLGQSGVDTYVWLDVDGNDEGDLHKALVDDDLLGYHFVDVHALPFDTPVGVDLDLPSVVVDAE